VSAPTKDPTPNAKALSPPTAPLPVIALVGRPNVGKSTLFNALIGERRAIVEDEPGVTRDRNYGEAHIEDRRALVIDTGGFDPEAKEPIWAMMREQVELAIEEAHVIILVLDTQQGVIGTDNQIYRMLAQAKSNVLVVVNKADNDILATEARAEGYRLGVDDVLPIAAKTRRNLRHLRDRILRQLPKDGPRVSDEDDDEARDLTTEEEKDLQGSADFTDPESLETTDSLDGSLPSSEVLLDPNRPLAVAVVGKPNVGKSTLVNRLLGKNRLLTDDAPGTTRDSIDTWILTHDRPYLLIDTAGLRRKSRIVNRVERFSAIRALESIRRADVVLLLIDATKGVTDQDKRIAKLITQYGKAGAIIVNKWDLMEKDSKTADEYSIELRHQMPYFDWGPILYLSALTGQRSHRIFSLVETVAKNHRRRIRTGALNRILSVLVQRHQPPIRGTRRPRLFFGSQSQISPPTFVIFAGYAKSLAPTYIRYIERVFREAADFTGTPMRIFLRERKRSPSKNRRSTNEKTRGRKKVKT